MTTTPPLNLNLIDDCKNITTVESNLKNVSCFENLSKSDIQRETAAERTQALQEQYLCYAKKYNYKRKSDFYDDCIRRMKKLYQKHPLFQTDNEFKNIVHSQTRSLLHCRNTRDYVIKSDNPYWFLHELGQAISALLKPLLATVNRENTEVPLNPLSWYIAIQSLPMMCDILVADPTEFEVKYRNLLPISDMSPMKGRQPRGMHYVHSKADIIAVIAQARNERSKVRQIQYDAQISHVFGDSNTHFLVMLKHEIYPISEKQLKTICQKLDCNWTLKYTEDLSKCYVQENELMFCELIENDNVDDAVEKKRIRVGSATPFWMYRLWVHKRMTAGLWLPNLIPGIASLCDTFSHVCIYDNLYSSGSSQNTTLCDYVTGYHIIDCEGEEIYYNDKNCNMKEIACNLGLLGIITDVEIECAIDPYFVLFEPFTGSKINEVFDVEDIISPQNKNNNSGKISKNDIKKQLVISKLQEAYSHDMIWIPSSKSFILFTHSKISSDDMQAKKVRFSPSTDWELNEIEFIPVVLQIINMLNAQLVKNGKVWSTQLAVRFYSTLFENLDLMFPKQMLLDSTIFVNPACDRHVRGKQKVYCSLQWVFSLPSISGEEELKEDSALRPNLEMAFKLYECVIKLYHEKRRKESWIPFISPLKMVIVRSSQCLLSNAYNCDIKKYPFCVCLYVEGIQEAGIYNYFYTQFTRELTQEWYAIVSEYFNNDMENVTVRPCWTSCWKYLNLKKESGGYEDEFICESIATHKHFVSQYEKSIAKFNKYRVKADKYDMFLTYDLALIF